MLENYKNKFIPLILPIALILIWHGITDGLELFSSYILPSPMDVVNSAWVVIENGKLYCTIFFNFQLKQASVAGSADTPDLGNVTSV